MDNKSIENLRIRYFQGKMKINSQTITWDIYLMHFQRGFYTFHRMDEFLCINMNASSPTLNNLNSSMIQAVMLGMSFLQAF